MKSCPLCGSDVSGQDAVEVLDEHRDMVAKARGAEEMIWSIDDVAGRLWRLAQRESGTKRDAEDMAWELATLRKDIREASRELGAAARRYREATRRVHGSSARGHGR